MDPGFLVPIEAKPLEGHGYEFSPRSIFIKDERSKAVMWNK